MILLLEWRKVSIENVLTEFWDNHSLWGGQVRHTCCETHLEMGLKFGDSYWASSHFPLQPALADPSDNLPSSWAWLQSGCQAPSSVLPHVLTNVFSYKSYYIATFYLWGLCNTLFGRSWRVVSVYIIICSHFLTPFDHFHHTSLFILTSGYLCLLYYYMHED